jgi:hypothetical protein
MIVAPRLDKRELQARLMTLPIAVNLQEAAIAAMTTINFRLKVIVHGDGASS